MRALLIGLAYAGLGLVGYSASSGKPMPGAPAATAALLDGSPGGDWPAFGRTYGEQHYSPLSQIDASNVGTLGLAWSFDLPAGNPVSGPIEVGGVLYTSTGYSIVRAFEATTGKLLWTFNPKAAEAAGHKLRQGWGSRGLAWWNGKIYVGTQDGRLIALDARDGRQLWSTMTLDKNNGSFISGAPRVFDGKVIIGHGGADSSDVRAYVTAYDAETGKQLWRFFIVPGDPAKGFEDETQAMAAKTWYGEWWKFGGGGAAFNTFTYDPETDTILIGTGNGAPWNRRIRSAGKGDNLFLCSIVALDAKTGKYKWHYQTNPGETWDYNSAMDMQLADLVVAGRPRKVLLHAPKNGFLYVIDRMTGKLISADAYTPVTWASGIDLKTGRPIETPGARNWANGFDLRPGPNGAHTWLPSAYSPKTSLIYLPVAESAVRFTDAGADPATWHRLPGNQIDAGVTLGQADGVKPVSALLAWDPAKRRQAWRVPTAGTWNGGILATAGDLVFQGQGTGIFTAYNATSGKVLWTFDSKAPVLAPPISYSVGGRQYVTVLAGLGTSAAVQASQLPVPVDYRTQARRILTFVLGGKLQLPEKTPVSITAIDDPDFKPDPASATRGEPVYHHCFVCHGTGVIAAGAAPDLRTSGFITSAEAFESVVRQGALVSNGMPRFEELTDAQLADLRQYLRTQARLARSKNP